MDDEQEPNELRDIRDVQPTSFRQVIGQEHVKKALEIAVEASFAEQKRLDDILLCGPPGLGKSGLVTVLQHSLGLERMTSVLAQSISNTAELNSLLLSANEGLLFLDEIHLLSHTAQHSLLKILDTRTIDINTGKTVTSIPVAPFTLVGASTDIDGVIGPLIDRFRLVLHLDYFSLEELEQIARQRLGAMGWKYEPELPQEIAKRARQSVRPPQPPLHAALPCDCLLHADVGRWLKAAMSFLSNTYGELVKSSASATWASTTCSRSISCFSPTARCV